MTEIALSIAEAASTWKASKSSIYQWCRKGHLKWTEQVVGKRKKMIVTGGEPPMRKADFLKIMLDYAREVGLRPGTFGQDGAGDFQVLVGDHLRSVPFKDRRSYIDTAKGLLDQIARERRA